MKLIKHKNLSTRAWMVALNEEDKEVLNFLYGESICWGFYSLWTKENSSKLTEPEVSHRIPDIPDSEDSMLLNHIRTKYPEAFAVGFFSYPKNFMTMEEKENE